MEINEFIDNLKRDKARGDLAPHQIILLLSLHKLYLKNKSYVIEIDDLIDTFSLIWKEHQYSFKTKNCSVGMPLKVFVNRGYLEIDIKEDIIDFRSKTELTNKIIKIEICTILKKLFQKPDIKKEFINKINS